MKILDLISERLPAKYDRAARERHRGVRGRADRRPQRLVKKHRILCQLAGQHVHVVKFLPPLNISQEDREWIASGTRSVVADAHHAGGAIWNLGKQLASGTLRSKTGG